MAVSWGLGGRALPAVWPHLLVHLAGHHTGLKLAPQQLLMGGSGVGEGLTSAAAEPGYAQELDEVIIVQLQLRLAALEHYVYGVAEPLGALLFVHFASSVLLRFQDSTGRPRSSVNAGGHRV